MLKANIITKAITKPLVGVKNAKTGLIEETNTMRVCSKFINLSIDSVAIKLVNLQ